MSAAIQNSASLESKCTEIYDIRFEVLFWMTCPLSTVKFRFFRCRWRRWSRKMGYRYATKSP